MPDHAPPPPTAVRSFASDNYAGVHPEVLAAIAAVNVGHRVSYGDDDVTARMQHVFRRHFGEQASAYCVFNGTGANVVALQSMTDRWDGVICAEEAHVNVDEGGAPEKVAGLKLLPLATADGKLTPRLVQRHAWGWGNQHRAQPRVVSLTQSTELGTCYQPHELAALCEQAHTFGMRVHLDGARLANAAATLDLPLRAISTDVGVDVLTFGGTKNGLMLGEAIVVLDPQAARGITYLRKSAMQLASKMRFLAAQLVALLDGDLWLRNARHANLMAQRLADAVRQVPQVRVSREVEANAVFAVLPPDVTARLQAEYPFYVWDATTGEVRWMTSFDTTDADVAQFAAALARHAGEVSASSR